MKPRTPSDLAADMAWQVVTPREKLPGPGQADMMQLPEEATDDEPLRTARAFFNTFCLALPLVALAVWYWILP